MTIGCCCLCGAPWLRSGGAASAAAVPATPRKGSSVSTATFNLVKNILGAGVLSLPAGVAAFSGNPYVRALPACPMEVIMERD